MSLSGFSFIVNPFLISSVGASQCLFGGKSLQDLRRGDWISGEMGWKIQSSQDRYHRHKVSNFRCSLCKFYKGSLRKQKQKMLCWFSWKCSFMQLFFNKSTIFYYTWTVLGNEAPLAFSQFSHFYLISSYLLLSCWTWLSHSIAIQSKQSQEFTCVA